MRVGFVGLGTMGLPMAQRLLQAGHELTCSSRSPRPVETLRDLGAQAADKPEDVVSASEVTFLCLPDDDTVISVVHRCLPSMSRKTIVDCSTVTPRTEITLGQRIAEAGGYYLDAPISGGPGGAKAGTLAVMVGGNASSYEKIRPVVEAFAGYVDLVGGIGAGQVVKLCNQTIVGTQLLALAECAELARRSGVDAARLHGALLRSTGDCVMARTRFPVPGVIPQSPASNSWRPDFTTLLMTKDLRIARDHAAEHYVTLSSVDVLLDLLSSNVALGNGPKDWSSFAALLTRQSSS